MDPRKSTSPLNHSILKTFPSLWLPTKKYLAHPPLSAKPLEQRRLLPPHQKIRAQGP
jgi:hypothetical protein